MQTQAHTFVHNHTPVHVRARRTHAYSHTFTITDARKYTCAQICIHTFARAHTHIHSQTHIITLTPNPQVIDVEISRRKLLEATPIACMNEDPVNFDTSEIPWWAWVKRFHLPEVRARVGCTHFDSNLGFCVFVCGCG